MDKDDDDDDDDDIVQPKEDDGIILQGSIMIPIVNKRIFCR